GSAGGRSSRWWSPAGGPTYARPASRGRGPIDDRSGSRELVQPSALRGRERLGVASEELAVHEHLREAHHARAPHQLHAPLRVLGEVDFREVQPTRFEDALHAHAEGAGLGRIDGDPAHYFIKYRSTRTTIGLRLPWPSLDSNHGRPGEDGCDRAAFDALWGGGSDPARIYPPPRTGERYRQRGQ